MCKKCLTSRLCINWWVGKSYAREAIRQRLVALFAQDCAPLEQPVVGSSAREPPHYLVENTSGLPPMPLPTVIPKSWQKELAVDNAARHDWIAEGGKQQREVVHGSYQRTSDFRISATDPDAMPMRLKGGGTHLGY